MIEDFNEFRKIKSLDYKYEINGNGTVFRNVKTQKCLKIKIDMHHSQKGYWVTFARHRGIPKRIMIHKAVAECWLGDIPDGMEVDHIDRNSLNNDYRNLRYVTKSEQMKNRDHTNISKKGAMNLHIARMERAKPVKISKEGEQIFFESLAACARYISNIEGITSDAIRHHLKRRETFVKGYQIEYLPQNK